MIGPARDPVGNLRCQVPGCHVVIRALTGLRELHKLQEHFARAHLARLTMDEALELRANWESRCEGGCGRARLDGHLTCGEARCHEAQARARRAMEG
jgi:hypothetical protein